VKAGWFWRGLPERSAPTAEPPFTREEKSTPYLFCVECGWEEPNPSLEGLLGSEWAGEIRKGGLE